jgi:hypothetical protein
MAIKQILPQFSRLRLIAVDTDEKSKKWLRKQR